MPKTLAIGYNGNPNLPLPGDTISMDAKELEEYIKCKRDPIYFISHYVKILNVDEGICSFTPYPFQADIIHSLMDNRFVIAKLPRQSGKSTVIICGYFLWYILFHTDVSVALWRTKKKRPSCCWTVSRTHLNSYHGFSNKVWISGTRNSLNWQTSPYPGVSNICQCDSW